MPPSEALVSSHSQRLYQRLLSSWLRFSGGRLPPGVRNIAFVRKAALGDVLMALAVIREFRNQNPQATISFFTDYPEMAQGLPFLNVVNAFERRPARHFNLRYEESPRKPARHWIQIMGESLGLKPSLRPECAAVSPDGWRDRLEELPRPRVLINRQAGEWTPNRAWPKSYWDCLVDRLKDRVSVLEVGVTPDRNVPILGGRYLDLRGETSRTDLIALTKLCDLVVTPISGPAHLAAAVGVKALVLSSGYEQPEYTHYPTSIPLVFPVECSPCWLRTPCPYELKCMAGISVDTVLGKIFDLLA